MSFKTIKILSSCRIFFLCVPHSDTRIDCIEFQVNFTYVNQFFFLSARVFCLSTPFNQLMKDDLGILFILTFKFKWLITFFKWKTNSKKSFVRIVFTWKIFGGIFDESTWSEKQIKLEKKVWNSNGSWNLIAKLGRKWEKGTENRIFRLSLFPFLLSLPLSISSLHHFSLFARKEKLVNSKS